MCTVLITYSTPPGPDEPVIAVTAGVDEAIAAAIADELTRAGHHVTCRPSVAIPGTGDYDLLVEVDRLQVNHRFDAKSSSAHRTPRHAAAPADRRPSPWPEPREGQSSIPITWAADWRAVDAWARSVGDHLAYFLDVRLELLRVRAELDRCRAMLRAATPEPRSLSAVELGRPAETPGRGAGRHHQHPVPAPSTRAGRT